MVVPGPNINKVPPRGGGGGVSGDPGWGARGQSGEALQGLAETAELHLKRKT